MKALISSKNYMPLSQQIHHSFFSAKGYDPFGNLKSHDGYAMHDSYFQYNKHIASAITHQNCQITFVSKFNNF
jgi:hypothetical protein